MKAMLMKKAILRRTAIVTGASRGIGRATAEILAKNGFDLLLNSFKSGEALKDFCIELENKYHIRAVACVGDVGDYSFVKKMINEAIDELGKIDVLINNAGISIIGLTDSIAVADFERVMAVNFGSVFYTCKEIIPHFVHNKAGKIINISSIWGEVGGSCESVYSASKGAMISFSKALAKELAPSGISVNVVSPGVIATAMNNCFTKEEMDSIIEEIPVGRPGNPNEIADVIHKLIDIGNYLTGQVIRVDGAMV